MAHRTKLAALTFALTLAAACNSRLLDDPEPLDFGGITHDADVKHADLVDTKNPCVGLDQVTCEGLELCAADTCDNSCALAPTYLGCRRISDAPAVCGPDPCTFCTGDDEVTCNNDHACTAEYCSDCHGNPFFVGCSPESENDWSCPELDCAPVCHNDSDCLSEEYCRAPDAVATACTSDNDCAAGQTCSEHQCGAQACNQTSDCPALFYCPSGQLDHSCQRVSCMQDGDCGSSGFCVDDACYDTPGMCSSRGV